MRRSGCRAPPSGLLLGVVPLLLAIQFSAAWPSEAQTERRYVLGQVITHNSADPPSISRGDFVVGSGLESGADRAARSGLAAVPGSPTNTENEASGAPLSIRPLPRTGFNWTHVAVPVSTGILGGGLGLLVGGAVGAAVIEVSNCRSWGCLGYPILGAAVGETVGLSSGVYLGTTLSTRRRGSYILTLLGGVATTALALGVGGDVVGHDADPLTLAAVPVLQLAVTIPIARWE